MSSASSEKTCVSVYVPVMGRSPRLDVPEVCVRVHVSIIRQIIAHGYTYVNEVRRLPRLLLPLRQPFDDSLGRLGVEGERRVNDNVMLAGRLPHGLGIIKPREDDSIDALFLEQFGVLRLADEGRDAQVLDLRVRRREQR